MCAIGVVGGVAAVCLVVLVVLLIMRRRKRQRAERWRPPFWDPSYLNSQTHRPLVPHTGSSASYQSTELGPQAGTNVLHQMSTSMVGPTL